MDVIFLSVKGSLKIAKDNSSNNPSLYYSFLRILLILLHTYHLLQCCISCSVYAFVAAGLKPHKSGKTSFYSCTILVQAN